uniref:Response regulatory domain-containing protein n=1 Tax=Leersia perrieri TaxID=77586 RepID=A0A0D9XRI7_9ORYZ
MNKEAMHGTVVSGKFPEGMCVLTVDENPVCLKVLEVMLHHCKYHAIMTRDTETALQMLRKRPEDYDLVISDVQNLDMDGFMLLELIGLEMDLPTQTMMKGVTHGACDYMVNPVNIKEIQNIWQHVVRKRMTKLGNHKHGDDGGAGHKVQSWSVEVDMVCQTQTKRKYSKMRRSDEDDYDENKENIQFLSQKKPRVAWTPDLHQDFVNVVAKVGVDYAVPKKILQMRKPNHLNRENVTSHLQKYRLYLKRVNNQTGMDPYQFPAGWKHINEQNYLKNYFKNGRYHLSPAMPPTDSSNLYTRINSASALGAHGLSLLSTQAVQLRNNQSNLETVQRGGSLLKNVVLFPYKSNGVAPSNQFALQSNSGVLAPANQFFIQSKDGVLVPANQYSVQTNGGFLATGNQFPVQTNDRFLAPVNQFPSNGGLSAPTNQFQGRSNGSVLATANQYPVHSNGGFFATAKVQISIQRIHLLQTTSAHLAIIFNLRTLETIANHGKLQCHPMFPDVGQKVGTSFGLLQASIPNINQLSSFAASGGQQTESSNAGNSMRSTEMINGNFTLGSNSSISSTVPSDMSFGCTFSNLQADSPALLPQMLDSGNAEDVLPMFNDIHDQQDFFDQLDDNDFLTGENGPEGTGTLDDIVAMLFDDVRYSHPFFYCRMAAQFILWSSLVFVFHRIVDARFTRFA